MPDPAVPQTPTQLAPGVPQIAPGLPLPSSGGVPGFPAAPGFQAPGLPGSTLSPATPTSPTLTLPNTPTAPLIPYGPIGPRLGPADSLATPPLPPLPTVPSVAPLSLPYGALDVPARARFTLLPTLSLFEEYSDNFNQTTTNKQSNFRSGIAPGLAVLFSEGPTQGLAGITLAGTYDTSDDEFSLFPALSAQVSWRATPRLILTVANSFTVSDQATQADTLGLRTGRDQYTSNLLAVTADYFFPTVAMRGYYRLGTFSGIGGSTTNAVGLGATTAYATNVLSVGYEYLNSRSSDDPSQDIDSQLVVASVGRPLSALLFAGVAASYIYTTESESQGGNFQIATVEVFGRYVIQGRWLLNGSIGVSQLFAESEPNRTVPAGSGNLSYFFPDGVATIGFSTGFANTFAYGQNFGVIYTSGVTGAVSYRFTPLISGFAGAYYRINIPADVGGGLDSINRDVRGASIGLGVQLRPWLNLNLGYSYIDQSNPTGGAQPFTENRGFISFNAAF